MVKTVVTAVEAEDTTTVVSCGQCALEAGLDLLRFLSSFWWQQPLHSRLPLLWAPLLTTELSWVAMLILGSVLQFHKVEGVPLLLWSFLLLQQGSVQLANVVACWRLMYSRVVHYHQIRQRAYLCYCDVFLLCKQSSVLPVEMVVRGSTHNPVHYHQMQLRSLYNCSVPSS